MKKYQEALMDINRSIQLVPENYQYHLVKAELLEKMQKYREAGRIDTVRLSDP